MWGVCTPVHAVTSITLSAVLAQQHAHGAWETLSCEDVQHGCCKSSPRMAAMQVAKVLFGLYLTLHKQPLQDISSLQCCKRGKCAGLGSVVPAREAELGRRRPGLRQNSGRNVADMRSLCLHRCCTSDLCQCRHASGERLDRSYPKFRASCTPLVSDACDHSRPSHI